MDSEYISSGPGSWVTEHTGPIALAKAVDTGKVTEATVTEWVAYIMILSGAHPTDSETFARYRDRAICHTQFDIPCPDKNMTSLAVAYSLFMILGTGIPGRLLIERWMQLFCTDEQEAPSAGNTTINLER